MSCYLKRLMVLKDGPQIGLQSRSTLEKNICFACLKIETDFASARPVCMSYMAMLSKCIYVKQGLVPNPTIGYRILIHCFVSIHCSSLYIAPYPYIVHPYKLLRIHTLFIPIQYTLLRIHTLLIPIHCSVSIHC